MTVYNESGDAEGTRFGRAGGKISFYGETPVVQASATTSVATTTATSSSPYGFATAAQANAIVTWVNAVDAALKNVGLIADS